MKFYQKTASIIFFIVYTTAIFGGEEIRIPVDLLDTIDQFRGDKGSYKKLFTQSTKGKVEEILSLDKSIHYSDCILCKYRTGKKSTCGVIVGGPKPYFNFNAYFPHESILLTNFNKIRILSPQETPLNYRIKYELKKGKVNIFFRDFDITFPDCTLEMLEDITSFAVSKYCDADAKGGEKICDGTIATCSKEGNVCVWKLQKGVKEYLKMSEIYPEGKIIVPTLQQQQKIIDTADAE